MADANNPLALVYDALWTCLESIEDFKTLFPNAGRHQVRYNTSLDYAPDPDVRELMPADYPRCRIIVAACEPKLHITNDMSQIDVRFRIEVCTGQQMQHRLMDAIWAIYRGYGNFLTYLNAAVTWNSKPCVTHLQNEAISITDEDRQRSRGTDQWIAICQCVVWIVFDTSDLGS